MSRLDHKAGETKLAVIKHLSLHIYRTCGHFADMEVAGISPTMRHDATVADDLLSRKCSKCGAKTPPPGRILYKS